MLVLIALCLFYEIAMIAEPTMQGYGFGDYRDFWAGAWQLQHGTLYHESQLRGVIVLYLHTPAAHNQQVYFPQTPVVAWAMQPFLMMPVQGELLYIGLTFLCLAFAGYVVAGKRHWLEAAVAGPALRVVGFASDTWLSSGGMGLAVLSHRRASWLGWMAGTSLLLAKPDIGVPVLWCLICSGSHRLRYFCLSLLVGCAEVVIGMVGTGKADVWGSWIWALQHDPLVAQADQSTLRGLLSLAIPDQISVGMSLALFLLAAALIWRRVWSLPTSLVVLFVASPYVHMADWVLVYPWLFQSARGRLGFLVVGYYLWVVQWGSDWFAYTYWFPALASLWIVMGGKRVNLMWWRGLGEDEGTSGYEVRRYREGTDGLHI